MPYTLRMPEVAANATHATLVCWNKAEGERINAGESIADVETDKAVLELPVETTGVIGKLLVANGTEVAVGAPIAILLAEGETLTPATTTDAPSPAVRTDAVRTDAVSSPALSSNAVSSNDVRTINVTPPSSDPAAAQTSSARILSSPVARLLAREHRLDLGDVSGSGPRGRITKNDVQQHLLRTTAPGETAASTVVASSVVASAARPHPGEPALATPISASSTSTVLALTSMRRTIARRLLESKTTVPHFYVRVTCEMDNLLAARSQINAGRAMHISVNDFVMRACAVALSREPAMNVSWREDGIHQFSQVDISMAVATPTGLYTPIIHDAANLPLSRISERARALAKQAREGTLQPAQYQGGTFSVSNLGMYGIDDFDAIINPPQAGILAVGAIRQAPLVRDGALVAGNVMRCVLSVDHRAVDGAVAARWLSLFRDLMQSPLKMLV